MALALANKAARSGATGMPDVAGMMVRTALNLSVVCYLRAVIWTSELRAPSTLLTTIIGMPDTVPYQAYKVSHPS